MGNTKKAISDSVLIKLAGGIPPSGFPIDERDIWQSLEHRLNAMFKLRHFDTLKSGDTLPEHAMIATYENIAVTSFGEKSKSTLPITPISLPKNMGVYGIYNPAYPDLWFIPIQRGQRMLLNTDSLLSELFGQISYEPKDRTIIYSTDLTLFGITSVTMELCVFEISEYSKTDVLPIPADYLDEIEKDLIQEFAPVVPATALVNNFTTEQPVSKP